MQATSLFELVRCCDPCLKKAKVKQEKQIIEESIKKKKMAEINQNVNPAEVSKRQSNISSHQNMQQMRHKQKMMQQAIAIEKGEVKEKEEVMDKKTQNLITSNVNEVMKNWTENQYVLPQINKLSWQADKDVSQCNKCSSEFTDTNRRHHCRACGKIYCDDCSPFVGVPLGISLGDTSGPVDDSSHFRVCEACVRKHVTLHKIEMHKEQVKQEKIAIEIERRREEWEKNQLIEQEKQKSKWTNLT